MVDENLFEEEIIKNTEEKAKKKFDNKLFKYLRIFERDELIAVRRFIISPYYNESQAVVELFQYVRRYHDTGYESHRLVNEVVFKHLFPNEPYHHQKLINLYSDLTLLLERYVAVQELEATPMTKHKVLIDAYGKRGKFDFFEKEIDKGMKTVDKERQKNNQYYKDRILLNSVMYEYPVLDQAKKNREHLPILLRDLNEYFYLMKLRYTIYYLNDTNVFKESIAKEGLIQEIEILKNNFRFEKSKLMKFYEDLIEFQQGKFDISKFRVLTAEFYQSIKSFQAEEYRAIYTILLNSIYREYNRNGFYLKEIFKMQVKGITQKILLVDGNMSEIFFLNTVSTGGRTSEFAQLEIYVELCEEYLKEEIRKDVLYLANAIIEYYQKEYLKSLKLIEKIGKTTFNVDLRSRLLRIRNYLELLQAGDKGGDAYDDLAYHAGLCTKFIKREKVLGTRLKDGYLNFLKIVRQIAITARNKDRFLNKQQKERERIRIGKIKGRLNNGDYISYKVWLVEQLDLIQR